jgi:uncharacterized protein YkwD
MIPIDPYALLVMTNQTRQELCLPPVQFNESLNRAALMRGTDIVTQGYWSHVSPTGNRAWPFIQESGYKYNWTGENLARGFTDAQSIYNAWINSPTHKANLSNPAYRDMGIAIVRGTQDGKPSYYVIQLFGSPINY